ncbi:MAG: hypothetical protein AAGA56_01855 [Myxococcota bacterium]
MIAHPIDFSRSRLIVRTRAEGPLARVAHELQIEAQRADGVAWFDDPAGSWRGLLEVPVASLRVMGSLRAGTDELDTSGLNRLERAEIRRRLRKTVLAAPMVVVEAEGQASQGRLRCVVPAASDEVPFAVEPQKHREGLLVRGRVALSLNALGIAEIKGPMGAFRVADRVEVEFDLFVTL